MKHAIMRSAPHPLAVGVASLWQGLPVVAAVSLPIRRVLEHLRTRAGALVQRVTQALVVVLRSVLFKLRPRQRVDAEEGGAAYHGA